MMNPLRFDEISRADCPSASSSFLLPEECTSSCSSEKLQALRKGSNREESAFTSRMKSQGVVCRLVTYNHGEDPSLDIHIHGGLGKPVVVDAVLSGGRAAQSGVQRGDRLLSIDGKKDFTHMSGKSVQASLRPPTTLIFMGFEGRQQSEVRLLAHSPAQVFFGQATAPVSGYCPVVRGDGLRTWQRIDLHRHHGRQRRSGAIFEAANDECSATPV